MNLSEGVHRLAFNLAILSTLVFSPLLVACTQSDIQSAPSASAEQSVFELEVNILGTKTILLLSSEGKLQEDVTITSAEGTVSLYVSSNTALIDEEGKPAKFIRIASAQSPLPLSDNIQIISDIFDLNSNITTLNYPMKLNLSYNQNNLPDNVIEKDINIACYQDAKWQVMPYRLLDAQNGFITTQVTRCATYAIVAPITTIATPGTPVVTEPSPSPSSLPLSPTVTVEVLYFHSPQRCKTCLCFEEHTRNVINSYFKDEVNSGKLTLHVLDFADSKNLPLVKKYQVVGSQLFINTVIDGVEHIRNVWEIYSLGCLSNPNAFDEGLRQIIQECLGG